MVSIEEEEKQVTDRESRVYRAEQNCEKEVKRSQKEQTDHVETILQNGRGPKQIYKGGPKKKICEVKK